MAEINLFIQFNKYFRQGYWKILIKCTLSVHLFNGDYLSIPEGTGSCGYLFHEIPGTRNSIAFLTSLWQHLITWWQWKELTDDGQRKEMYLIYIYLYMFREERGQTYTQRRKYAHINHYIRFAKSILNCSFLKKPSWKCYSKIKWHFADAND